MTPIEVINQWCDKAHESGKWKHKAVFWIIRDILEGIGVPAAGKRKAVEWFMREVKNTPDKKKILEAVKNAKRKN